MALFDAVSPNILTVLREQTRDAHVALEQKLDWQIIASDRGCYGDMLARFYGLVRSWEIMVREQVRMTPLASVFESRWKSSLLESDLLYLGWTTAEIQMLDRMNASAFHYSSSASLLGAAYVMEGSTLGGQVITRMLKHSLNLDPGAGCSYFSSYGPQVGSMWKEFGTVLQRHLVEASDREAAVTSARNTFRQFDEWLSGVIA